MKVYDAASIRNVALVGHTGSGKTQLAAAMLSDRRDGEPVRKGGRRHDGHRFRRRRDCAQAHPLGQPRLRGVEQAQDQRHRYAGHRQLPERARAALTVADAAARGGRCGGRRDGADREGLGSRRGAAAAAHRRAEPHRSRSGEPRSVAPVAARVLRPDGDPDPAADRRGERLQGRRRSREPQGIHLPDRRERQVHRGRGARPTWPRPSNRRARR